MTVTAYLRPALATLLLASVTACGASSVPDGPASTSTGPASAGTHRPASARPVTATMPDVIGGNAGRAYEQMGSTLEMTFEDASGRGRRVDDLAAWRICTSRPGPNQQITGYPVVFGVVRASEKCGETATE
ncbi:MULTISPECIES: hypothetical protein [Streptomyces]|uniref:hypothetical protein n=1 Tax=Streptomyces TaxID=1883 RepID=UPI00167BEF7A|nr:MULTISPECIES: hypothetical protein [Streptomyces]MBK3525931.1 hypothetical protein [Streptomyces sp. MBT70]